ncbi:MAG: hypothetical protein ACK2UC_03130 [Anaerolineae bacterium]|jgi:hypothetical protein
MEEAGRRLSLHRPATYQIQVPGHVDESWSDWLGGMTVTIECQDEGSPVTTLTGSLDQAALHGLLRRLYSLGLPLLAVTCLASNPEPGDEPCKSKEKPGF